MKLSNRQKRILERLDQAGAVQVQGLSASFQVSEVTIRKDLQVLEDAGMLFRTHGGAARANPYARDRSLREKEGLMAREKGWIAREAHRFIGEHDSVILASGTTIQAIARSLRPERPLRVITASLHASLELATRPNVSVHQLGGDLRVSSASVVGPGAEEFLEQVTCGVLFLGVDGICVENGISTTDLAEARLNRACMRAAQNTVVVADHTKFGRRGFARIGGLHEIQHIVTDPGLPVERRRELQEMGVTVTVAAPIDAGDVQGDEAIDS